jgi:hypothetical protein
LIDPGVCLPSSFWAKRLWLLIFLFPWFIEEALGKRDKLGGVVWAFFYLVMLDCIYYLYPFCVVLCYPVPVLGFSPCEGGGLFGIKVCCVYVDNIKYHLNMHFSIIVFELREVINRISNKLYS